MKPPGSRLAAARGGTAARGWLALALGAAALLGGAVHREPPPPAASSQAPLVSAGGRPESCLACHSGMTGFSPAHDPRAIGCVRCHLGDRDDPTAAGAHAGMTRTPGNLSIVRQTCATAACHASIGERLRNSPMNTMSGVIAVDKHVFGENPDLDRPFVASQLGHSSADGHLRTLCVSCHLGNDKSAPGPIDEASRGGGCSACHLDYGPRAREELALRSHPDSEPRAPQAHPLISLGIPDQACFGCHSRSGRIATNYEGWHETPPEDPAVRAAAREHPGNFRLLPDGRIFEKMPADIHFTRGLARADCHLAAEVMGDGIAHPHEEGAVKVACTDCHSDRPASTRSLADLDPETRMVVLLRGLAVPGRRFVATRDGTAAYPNVYVDPSGETRVLRRAGGAALRPKPPGGACGRNLPGHAALDCGACHSAWASQCVSCHTQAMPREKSWDHLAGREITGAWEETAADFFADPPALGVVGDGSAAPRRIATFVPGMVLTLNQGAPRSGAPDAFRRLFAPASPHTTTDRPRDCVSCHANPSALGYGRGVLRYRVVAGTGTWTFQPELPPRPEDGLPRDAWIGFLQEPPGAIATRLGARAFTLGEQRSILLVGACLACHRPTEAAVVRVFADFGRYREHLSPACVLPAWVK